MYNTIDNERKNNIIESLKEYHEENASIIYDIFEKLYQDNKITDVKFLDVLEYKA